MKEKILNNKLRTVSGGIIRKEKDGSLTAWGLTVSGKKWKRSFDGNCTGLAAIDDWEHFYHYYELFGYKDFADYIGKVRIMNSNK